MKRQLVITVAVMLAAALQPATSTQAAAGETHKQQQSEGKPFSAMAAPSPAPQAGDDFVIGNGDVLAINVWKEPDVSRTLPVRPDGKISLPLVGDIQASGLTTTQLRANLERALRAYIWDPAVTLIVQEVKSQTYDVLGDVLRPGAYALSKPTTVLDAIAQAGGFRDWAKLTKIYVLRLGANGSQERLPFNYKQVIKGEKLSQNVQLKSGDVVVVP